MGALPGGELMYSSQVTLAKVGGGSEGRLVDCQARNNKDVSPKILKIIKKRKKENKLYRVESKNIEMRGQHPPPLPPTRKLWGVGQIDGRSCISSVDSRYFEM